MADRVKGITIELNGDVTPLNKALSGANKEIKTTQTALKDVEKLLKLDPKNVDLLAQRQRLLAQAVEETRKKLDTLKEAEAQAQEQFARGEISQEQYDALKREIIATEQELSRLEKAAAQSNATLAHIGAVAQEISDKTGKWAEKTKAISTAAAGALAAATASAVSFEQSFGKLSTLLDDATTDFDAYKQSIIDASNASGVAINEYTDAVYNAISAGVDQAKAVEFVAQANALARGGFTSLGNAVDVLTTAMNGYGESAGSANKIADILITTQNLGKTTVDELSSSLGQVIPSAAAVNVSISEVAAAYALMTKNGVATSIAGTQIRAMLSELGKSGSTADKALRELTGKGFAQLKAEGMGLTDVLSLIEKAASEDGKSLKDMFGSVEAGSAALIIARSHGAEFNDMLSQMGSATGAASKAFDKVSGTSGAQLAQMLNKLKNTAVELGGVLMPVFESAVGGLQSAADRLSALDSEQLKTVATIAAVVAGISPVLSLISKISGAVAALMPVLSSLNAVMAANPAAAVAVGVVALTAAVVAFAKSAKDGKTTTADLTKSAEGLGTAIDKANAAYETQAADIQLTYAKAQPYLKRLEELEKQSSLTAGEQWEYAKSVEALNGLYPDLNLQIDENTGKLADNILNIEAQTKALRDAAIQQALQAKYNGILEAMAQAQVEVYENQVKLRDAEAELTAKKNAANMATMAYLTAEQEYNEALERGAADLAIYRANMEEMQRQMVLANDAVEDAQSKVDGLNDAIQKGQSKVQEYANAYDSAVRGIASIMSSEGTKIGEAFGAGLAQGIRNKIPVVEVAAGSAAKSMTKTAKTEVRVASPSKVAAEIGRYWDMGLVEGMMQGKSEVEDASAEVAQMMIPTNNYSTTTNTTNHNVGGISVTVNTAPGQDVQAIAEAVMDEIQAAVEREGAAL